jgi:hypothetical protein
MPSRELTCRELEREITAYLDRTLAPRDRDRFEAHRRACPRCRLHVAQWRSTIEPLGRLEDRAQGATRTERERLLALFREHGLHRQGRCAPLVPLGLGSELVAPGDHVAYFWESEQEFAAAVGFVAAGAARGEPSILLGHEEANERLEAEIERAGLDAALRGQDLLSFIPGTRSADALLEEIDERIRSAVDRGAPLVRILGNLGWRRSGWPEDRELLRLEARVTDAIRKLPVVVICAYDVCALPGRNLLLGGFECHPLTYRRDALRVNDHYVLPAPFLARLAANPA